jgi:hypothetical protein
MAAEGIVEQAKLFNGKVGECKKCMEIYAIANVESMTYWTENFKLSDKTETTTQDHVIGLLNQEIRRADPSFHGIKIRTSPPSTIGYLDFTIYFIDGPSKSMVRKAAENVKDVEKCTFKGPLREAEQTMAKVDEIFIGQRDAGGIAYVHCHVDKGKRDYRQRLCEVYLSYLDNAADEHKENRAIGLARFGAHELAHLIAELGAQIDGKGGLDSGRLVLYTAPGPVTFPNGKQLPSGLVKAMANNIQKLKKMA